MRTLLIATFMVAALCAVLRTLLPLAQPAVSIFVLGALPAVVLVPWAIYRRIKQQRLGAWLWLALFAAALGLYLVSIGPVTGLLVWLDVENRTIIEWFPEFYAPIIWTHANTPLHDVIEWYVDYWQHLGLTLR